MKKTLTVIIATILLLIPLSFALTEEESWIDYNFNVQLITDCIELDSGILFEFDAENWVGLGLEQDSGITYQFGIESNHTGPFLPITQTYYGNYELSGESASCNYINVIGPEDPIICNENNFDFNGPNFIIKNSNGNRVAAIDKNGIMLIKNILTSDSTPSSNSFKIQDLNGNIVSYIDINGNLYLEGNLQEDVSNIPQTSNKEFIIKTGSTNIAIFDDEGNLKLKSCLVENSARL
ncbi:hypothetical protein K8R47_00840 [archaeon]|nr:hypothetical protein [archaeon]